jgi:hypothetical protein
MCEKLKDEPYTKMKEWQVMLKHHEHVHSSLKEYVILSQDEQNESQKRTILDEISLDTKVIFDNLTQIIDTYKG